MVGGREKRENIAGGLRLKNGYCRYPNPVAASVDFLVLNLLSFQLSEHWNQLIHSRVKYLACPV